MGENGCGRDLVLILKEIAAGQTQVIFAIQEWLPRSSELSGEVRYLDFTFRSPNLKVYWKIIKILEIPCGNMWANAMRTKQTQLCLDLIYLFQVWCLWYKPRTVTHERESSEDRAQRDSVSHGIRVLPCPLRANITEALQCIEWGTYNRCFTVN